MSLGEHEATVVAPSEGRARVGSVLLGKWKLERLIGEGGMSAVYAATHRNGFRAAVKVLSRSTAPGAARRMLREGLVANAIDHAGVVRVLDDDVDELGTPFLVMELLEGVSLDRRIAEGHLSLGEVISIAIDGLDILDAAHARGILHRDIKPANFMQTPSGLKLLDFGISRFRDEAWAGRPTLFPAVASDTLTVDGCVLGTPSFMPPEQARGRWSEMDATSDLWAFGATIYTLVSGRKLRRAPTAQEELLCAMMEPVLPMRTLLPGIAADLADVLDRALAFDKSRRWQSAREMREAFRSVVVPSSARGAAWSAAMRAAPAVLPSAMRTLPGGVGRTSPSAPSESASPPAPPVSREIVEPAPATVRSGVAPPASSRSWMPPADVAPFARAPRLRLALAVFAFAVSAVALRAAACSDTRATPDAAASGRSLRVQASAPRTIVREAPLPLGDGQREDDAAPTARASAAQSSAPPPAPPPQAIATTGVLDRGRY